jgi:crotonobetainyl-CoA:carnitine CoA-transferase CaiB-like acyl-CoA transferase
VSAHEAHALLRDVRVALLGSGTALSMFGAVLGDQGAEVIRVESPHNGDELRRRGPFVDQHSLTWAVAARSTRSVTCDLGHPDGMRLAARLLARCHIVGEELGPGGLEALGFDTHALQGPRAIVRFSGRGVVGPAASSEAPELIALALSGLLALTGQPDRPPVPFGVRLAEQLAGVSGATAALAALLDEEPDREKQPVVVDIATHAAALRMTEWTVAAYDRLGIVRHREGNRPSTVAPLDVYITADGDHVAIVGGSDANFTRLANAMNRLELLADERYATAAARVEHGGEINDLVATWVGSNRTEFVEQRCIECGAPFGRVAGPAQMLADAHLAARGDLVIVDDPMIGSHIQAAPHPRVLGSPSVVPSPAPTLGQHNEDVWCVELGLPRSELDRLRELGVV